MWFTRFAHSAQEEKKLIGDIAPKKIGGSAEVNKTGVGSAWSNGTTWEERDVSAACVAFVCHRFLLINLLHIFYTCAFCLKLSSWARVRLQELVETAFVAEEQAVAESIFKADSDADADADKRTGHMCSVKTVNTTGDACVVSLISHPCGCSFAVDTKICLKQAIIRGKPRHIFTLSFSISWELKMAGEVVQSGTLKYIEVGPQEVKDSDFDVEDGAKHVLSARLRVVNNTVIRFSCTYMIVFPRFRDAIDSKISDFYQEFLQK